MTATRLQLGAGRLENLDARVVERFLDPSWIHLGTAESEKQPHTPARYAALLLRRPRRTLRLAWLAATGRLPQPQPSKIDPAEMYRRTRFEPFHWDKGDRLGFPDGSFDYIFSEHFFHHLFFDEAFALFAECRRVLAPHGVIRTVVPDADLRTYEPPEPAGFPDPELSFTAPLKHKTRYSVYFLAEALRLAGLDPVPLRYCDRAGTYVRREPRELGEVYARCGERELIFDLSYIMRPDSLIVDGIRRPVREG